MRNRVLSCPTWSQPTSIRSEDIRCTMESRPRLGGCAHVVYRAVHHCDSPEVISRHPKETIALTRKRVGLLESPLDAEVSPAIADDLKPIASRRDDDREPTNWHASAPICFTWASGQNPERLRWIAATLKSAA